MEFDSPGAVVPAGSQTERRLRLLIETGILLASERSLDVLVRTALQAGLRLSEAQFGAFFYKHFVPSGEPFTLYQAVGVPLAVKGDAGNDSGISSTLDGLRPAEVSEISEIRKIPHDSFLTQATLRLSDITVDPRYMHRFTAGEGSLPFAGITPRHRPIRSYLSVPVRSRTGDVFGCLIYGHSGAGVFTPVSEEFVTGIAAQAAGAIDHLRRAESLKLQVSRATSQADTAQALQRETTDRLRQALSAAQLGSWTWDRATDRLYLDERAAEILDAEPHAPLTRAALRKRIAVLEDRPYTLESLQRFLASGGSHAPGSIGAPGSVSTAEYRVDSPTGIQTWVQLSGIATFAPGSSRIIGMAGTVQDITSGRAQESALRQSEKLAATGRLAATIAHEINNPLEAVTNLIYLSRTNPGVPSSVQLLLETADTELARVAQIAQQTLGFYRDTTHPIEIELNRLLHSVVDLFARKMASRKITSTLDLEPGLRIKGLQGEIRQVFSNLVVNAIDSFPLSTTLAAAPKPGRIHIRGRHLRRRRAVSILICDEGSGIPGPVRQRIFSPFFTTKLSVGTGLGLWVTRGFVEKQGGSIRYRTRTGDASGTIFRIVLPVATPAAARRSELPAQRLSA